MKKSLISRIPKVMGMAFVLLGIFNFTNIKMSQASPASVGVSFQVFYDELLPYGDWVSDPTYGYIWIPNVGPGFQPYASNGHWVMTNYGNTWVSNYDWGWAPFHYGRWFFDDYYGWAWVPGYDWGPAWVSWRTGGGYYGWAPLRPGLNIQVAVNIPSSYWIFVPQRRFMSRNMYRYYIPRRNVNVIYQNTTIINNTYVYNNKVYMSGPRRQEIERVSRNRVPVYAVNNSTRPGRATTNRNTVQVYRPEISRSNTAATQQARPSRVTSATEYKAGRTNNSAVNGNINNSGRTSPENRVGNTANSINNNNRTVTSPNTRINGANRTAPNNREAVSPNNNRQNTPSARPAVGNQRTSQPNVRSTAPATQRQPANVRNSTPRQQAPANVRSSAPARQQPASVQRQASPSRSNNAGAQVRRPAQNNRSSSPAVSSSSNNRSSNAAARGSSSRRGNN